MASIPQTPTVSSNTAACASKCQASLSCLLQRAFEDELSLAAMQDLAAVLELGLEGQTVEAQQIDGIDYWFQAHVKQILEHFRNLKERNSKRYTQFVSYAKSNIDQQLKRHWQ